MARIVLCIFSGVEFYHAGIRREEFLMVEVVYWKSLCLFFVLAFYSLEM